MQQIPLDLAFPPRFGADDFLVTSTNEVAYASLLSWPDWPDKVMLLVGPEGSGKSHLASIWAAQSDANMIAAASLAQHRPHDLAPANGVIEGADEIGTDETALFHFLNASRESGSFALLTARSAPGLWRIETPDLLSRLRLAPVLSLGMPDDALVQAVLVKLFADRQLIVDSSVTDYLVRRMERSVAAARKLVEALDLTSLASGRRISRATAAAVLASLEQDDASRHGDVTGLGQNQTVL